MQDRAALTLLLNLSLPTAMLALSKPLPLARSKPRTVKPPCLDVDGTLFLGPFSLVSLSTDTAVVSVSTVPERNKQSGVGPSSIPLPCSPCLHASVLPRFPSNLPFLLGSSYHSWSSFLGSYTFSHSLSFPSPPLLTPRFHPSCLSTEGHLHNFISPVSPPRLGAYYPDVSRSPLSASSNLLESNSKSCPGMPLLVSSAGSQPSFFHPILTPSARYDPFFMQRFVTARHLPRGARSEGGKPSGPRRRLCSS